MPDPNLRFLSSGEIGEAIGILRHGAEFDLVEIFQGMLLQFEKMSLNRLRSMPLQYYEAYYEALRAEGFPGLSPDQINALDETVAKMKEILERIRSIENQAYGMTFRELIPDEKLASLTDQCALNVSGDYDLLAVLFDGLKSKNPLDRYRAASDFVFMVSRLTDLAHFGQERLIAPGTWQIPVGPLITYPGYHPDDMAADVALSQQRPSRELLLALPPNSLRAMRSVPFTRQIGRRLHIERSDEFPQLAGAPRPAEGQVYLPLAFEAHYAMAQPYGASIDERNMILQYQNAINRSMLAGAVVEVAGRVDLDFLKWITGEKAGDLGPAPDVEVVYVFSLPSGGTYHFPLKLPRRLHAAIRYPSPSLYSSHAQDMQAIRMIRSFLSTKDKSHFYSLLAGVERGGELSATMSVPEYQNYEQSFWESLYFIKERAITSELEEQEATLLDEVIRTHGTPEQLDPVVREAVLGMPRGKKIYHETNQQTWDAAIQAVIARIMDIRAHEYGAEPQESEDRMHDARLVLGYDPDLPREGFPLSVHYIITDTLLPFISKKKKTKEFEGAYPDPREQYESTEGVSRFFSNPSFDKARQSMTVVDPALPKSKQERTEYNLPAAKVEKIYREAVVQSVKRAEKHLEGLLQESQKLESMLSLTGEQETRRRTLRALFDRYEKRKDSITVLQERIRSLNKDKDEILKGIKAGNVPAKYAKYSNEFLSILQRASKSLSRDDIVSQFQRAFELRTEKEWGNLEVLYRESFGMDEWNVFAVRVVRHEYVNQVVLTYAVMKDGTMLFNIAKGGTDIVSVNHSDLAGGRNVYGAGEVVFEKVSPGSWRVIEVNNGSGHYTPDGRTLYYATNILAAAGFDVSSARRIDSVLRIDVDTGFRLHPDQVRSVQKPETL
ncbi:hypothetical protein HY622_03265 [Candidatus Uhrbacteria bacterium]|nr:hypothetical protein [Candidatus Uhrbacteria bacterium]